MVVELRAPGGEHRPVQVDRLDQIFVEGALVGEVVDGEDAARGARGHARDRASVATQLGYGVESVRMWVKQADIDDGVTPGVSSAEAQRMRELEQENRELRRANEVLKRAASFFGAELDRHYRK